MLLEHKTYLPSHWQTQKASQQYTQASSGSHEHYLDLLLVLLPLSTDLLPISSFEASFVQVANLICQHKVALVCNYKTEYKVRQQLPDY